MQETVTITIPMKISQVILGEAVQILQMTILQGTREDVILQETTIVESLDADQEVDAVEAEVLQTLLHLLHIRRGLAVARPLDQVGRRIVLQLLTAIISLP